MKEIHYWEVKMFAHIDSSLQFLGLRRYVDNFIDNDIDDFEVEILILNPSNSEYRRTLDYLIPEKKHLQEFIREFRRKHNSRVYVSDNSDSATESESEQEAEEVDGKYLPSVFNRDASRLDSEQETQELETKYRPIFNDYDDYDPAPISPLGIYNPDDSFRPTELSPDTSTTTGLLPEHSEVSLIPATTTLGTKTSSKLCKILEVLVQIFLVTILVLTVSMYYSPMLPHIVQATTGGIKVLRLSFQTVYTDSVRFILADGSNHSRGNIIERLSYYERLYGYQAFLLGSDDVDTLNTQYKISDLLISQNENFIKEAITAIEHVHQKRAVLLGAEHPDTVLAKYKLAKARLLQPDGTFGALVQKRDGEEAASFFCGDNENCPGEY